MPSYTQGTSQEVLPDGSEVAFVVENATEKESSNGNEMIELELRIMNGSVKGPLVYDNLVFTEKSYWKIDSFRESTGEKLIPGQQVVFNSDDCIGRRGRVVLTIDVYQGRSKNKVGEYVLPSDATAQASPVPSSKNELGEPLDIPF
jgi:Protein of unknown function (DUF669)